MLNLNNNSKVVYNRSAGGHYLDLNLGISVSLTAAALNDDQEAVSTIKQCADIVEVESKLRSGDKVVYQGVEYIIANIIRFLDAKSLDPILRLRLTKEQ